jgi:hypothetical protein
VNDSGGGRSTGRRDGRYRSLPPWLQWLLPFAVGGGLILALVLFVQHETNGVPATAYVSNPKAVAEQNREDAIIVRQQQAPHLARLRAGESPAAGLHAAVVAYMTHQINLGTMDGPIRHSSCRAAPGGTPQRLVFHCAVTASAQRVTYPFDGVVAPATGVITYCQRVEPPVPSMNVPVSRRCT